MNKKLHIWQIMHSTGAYCAACIYQIIRGTSNDLVYTKFKDLYSAEYI